MNIGDIMVRDVVAVPLDMPIADVADLLIKHNIHAVPVVDEERKVRGIISETDFFLKNSVVLHLPTYVETIRQGVEKQGDDWKNSPEIGALLRATAKDIMQENCVTLPEAADVRDLLALVRMHHYKTFPVTDHTGTLTGSVSLIDTIPFLEEAAEQYLK